MPMFHSSTRLFSKLKCSFYLRQQKYNLDNLKAYARPCTTDWILNLKIKAKLCEELEFDMAYFDFLTLNESWRNKQVSIDGGSASDLVNILSKSLKKLPKKLLIVFSEWKVRAFLEMHEAVPGDFVAVPHAADPFLR